MPAGSWTKVHPTANSLTRPGSCWAQLLLVVGIPEEIHQDTILGAQNMAPRFNPSPQSPSSCLGSPINASPYVWGDFSRPHWAGKCLYPWDAVFWPWCHDGWFQEDVPPRGAPLPTPWHTLLRMPQSVPSHQVIDLYISVILSSNCQLLSDKPRMHTNVYAELGGPQMPILSQFYE